MSTMEETIQYGPSYNPEKPEVDMAFEDYIFRSGKLDDQARCITTTIFDKNKLAPGLRPKNDSDDIYITIEKNLPVTTFRAGNFWQDIIGISSNLEEARENHLKNIEERNNQLNPKPQEVKQ